MCARDSTEWYPTWYNEEYLALYAHCDAVQARRFVGALWSNLELRAGMCIADIPCGAGRHSLIFAERGACVVGVDPSSLMLTRAAAAAADFGVQPLFVQGYPLRLPLADHFQVVLSAFSSFGYYTEDAESRAALTEFVRVLAPGGMLVLDMLNPAWLEANFIPELHRDTADSEVKEWREYDAGQMLLTKRMEVRRGIETRTILETVRLYDSGDLISRVRKHGLTPVEVWGDYTGAILTDEAPRLILFAKK